MTSILSFHGKAIAAFGLAAFVVLSLMMFFLSPEIPRVPDGLKLRKSKRGLNFLSKLPPSYTFISSSSSSSSSSKQQ